jgi:hypothetical protein
MNGATPQPPLVIAGGSEPDWGPADVPAAAAQAPAPAATLGASLRRAKLRQALRRGLKVRVTLPQGGRVSAAAAMGRRAVARSKPRRLKAGQRTITLKFTKRARRTLARKRSVKLAIRVSVTPRGTAKQTTTLTARLRR